MYLLMIFVSKKLILIFNGYLNFYVLTFFNVFALDNSNWFSCCYPNFELKGTFNKAAMEQCRKMAQKVHKLIFHLAFFCFWRTQCAFSLPKILRLVILLLNFDIFQNLGAFFRLWILAFFCKFNNKQRKKSSIFGVSQKAIGIW